MGLKIQYFQHVPYEGPGYISDWAVKNGHQMTGTKLYEGQELPDVNDLDWLVIMGGSMSIYDENISWLAGEKDFIKRAIDAGKTVIGICLGAQLIADVLGAKVYPNKEKEIGWWPVKLTPEGEKQPLLKDLPEEFVTFHWHGDMFDIPEGAVHLIASDVCSNQAFIFKDRVLALQFHFETTESSVKDIIENSRHELVEAPHIEPEDRMISQAGYFMPDNNKRLEMILDRLAGKPE